MTQQHTQDGPTAYAADLAKRPTYHDGTPRKTWEQLCPIAQWSWSRPDSYLAKYGHTGGPL